MMSTRIKLSAVICFLFVCLISCNKKSELVYISYERPDNLIPILNMNEEGKYLSELIYDGLVNKTTVSDEGKEQYEWTLVSEGGYVEESPDNRFLISIYLKKGIKWHHGKELTSKDVLYTWKAIQQSNSPLKGWLSSFVEDISLVENENYKFKIKLKVERSKEAFMELFAPLKILPHEYADNGIYVELPYDLSENSKYVNAFKWKPVGTGPYSISERESEYITLKSNPEYNSTNAPKVPVVKYMIEKDRNMAIKTLNNSQYGVIFNVNPESFEALNKDKTEYTTYIPYGFYVIAYNTLKQPFNDINFRKAVNSLTNKDELVKTFLEEVTPEPKKFINHSIFPSNSRYYINSPQLFQESTPFDPSAARTFLRLSQDNGKSFNLLVSSVIDGENRIKSFSDSYSRLMKNEGINVQITDVTSPVYYQKIRDRDYDAVLIQLAGYDHLFDIRGLFKAGGERNFWGLNDNELNILLEQFGTTIAWDKLLQNSIDIHARIEKLTPGCFVFTVPRRSYYSKEINGVYVHPEVGFSTVESWSYKNK
jgi:peptide/nickel transport system substrate-binding protein